MGLPVARVKVAVYVLSALLAAVAGILVAAQTSSGLPTIGEGRELEAIAAVVIGGTLLTRRGRRARAARSPVRCCSRSSRTSSTRSAPSTRTTSSWSAACSCCSSCWSRRGSAGDAPDRPPSEGSSAMSDRVHPRRRGRHRGLVGPPARHRVLVAHRRRAVRGGRAEPRNAPNGAPREFGVPGYTDLDEMLERERPDLVSVCLPNEGHFEPTLQIIRAGFPLLVEKPLVFELDAGGHAAGRGGRPRPVLRDQLQPPLRPPDAAGRRGDRRRRDSAG